MSEPEAAPGSFAKLLMSSRAVLWVGFGSFIALMLLIAFSASHALGRIESTNSEIRQGYLQRDDLLNRLRAALYRSGIDLRDYLLHPDPQPAERRRAEIFASQQEMNGALKQYRRGLPAEEAAAVDELQRDVDDYFAMVAPVLAWDAETRRTQGNDFLRRQVFPRNQQMLRLSERMRQMDIRQLGVGVNRVAAVFTDFRREIVVIAALTIVFGLCLAIFIIGRVQALERESGLRFRQVEQAHKELHRLSARLVAAQEEERRNLSRELHDEVGQSMSALLVELGNLDSMLPPGEPKVHEQLLRVKRLAETNVGVVRNMALLLRPSMLDDLGLVPALKWQAREVARRTGMKVRVDAEDVPDALPDEYRTCIYRVVQEALHNATRHSQATHACVTVRQEEQQIRVTIQDDGHGFQPRLEKGMGIVGMEERVRHLGGIFQIESSPGHGAAVSISLPFQEHHDVTGQATHAQV
jgi:signal transduction histidine kinase